MYIIESVPAGALPVGAGGADAGAARLAGRLQPQPGLAAAVLRRRAHQPHAAAQQGGRHAGVGTRAPDLGWTAAHTSAYSCT